MRHTKFLIECYLIGWCLDSMKRLQELSCNLLAISATLTAEQIQLLKQSFLHLHGSDCVVITQGVHWDNLVLQLKRYRRQRQSSAEIGNATVTEHNSDGSNSSYDTAQSSWLRTALSIKHVSESQVTVVYLDFMRNVKQMTELLNNNSVKAIKYTGKMALQDKVQAESRFLKGDISVLVATEPFEFGVDNPRVIKTVSIVDEHGSNDITEVGFTKSCSPAGEIEYLQCTS